jgi:hypothetical protein
MSALRSLLKTLGKILITSIGMILGGIFGYLLLFVLLFGSFLAVNFISRGRLFNNLEPVMIPPLGAFFGMYYGGKWGEWAARRLWRRLTKPCCTSGPSLFWVAGNLWRRLTRAHA